MKLLLDTNVFIWASREPGWLTPIARQSLSDPLNERYVSVASFWEMQIKQSLGKLPLPSNVAELGLAWMRSLAADLLPIELGHIGRLGALPPNHRDPFDRMLIAQALAEGLHIVTADAAIRAYNVPTVW